MAPMANEILFSGEYFSAEVNGNTYDFQRTLSEGERLALFQDALRGTALEGCSAEELAAKAKTFARLLDARGNPAEAGTDTKENET